VIAVAVVVGLVLGVVGWRRVRRIEETTERIEADVKELGARDRPVCMLADLTRKDVDRG